MTNKQDFSDLVTAQVNVARLKQCLSIRELARRAGVAQTPIQKLCTGGSPHVSVYVLGRVADVLDVSLDYLTGRNGYAVTP